MKTNKEYPATHSMMTSWFFVDEDDNVAIMSMDDNGPIPLEAMGSDNSIESLMYDDVAEEENGIKKLNLTDDQVLAMLEPFWKEDVPEDICFYDTIFQVYEDKKDVFLQHLNNLREKLDDTWHYQVYILSEKQNIFLVNNIKDHHDAFLKDNKVVKRFCESPDWDNITFREELVGVMEMLQDRCPYFLYDNDYNYVYPHERISVPAHPVKFQQMPERLRDKIIRLPLRFAETPKIQLAYEHPCYSSVWHSLFDEDGEGYVKVKLASGGNAYVANYDFPAEDLKAKHLTTFKSVEAYFGKPRVLDEADINRLKSLKENKDYKEYDD